MQRYVALVVQEPGCWTAFFPEFPGVGVSGFPLHMALWRAQRELGARGDAPRPWPGDDCPDDRIGDRGRSRLSRCAAVHHRHPWTKGARGDGNASPFCKATTEI